MPRHFKVHELLDRKELDELEVFAREPGRTVDECHEWMQARGYTLSRTAVWAWLDAFRLEDKTNRAAEVSRAYLDAARNTDQTAVAEASLRKFQELVFDALVRDDDLPAGDLLKLGQAMRHGLASHSEIIDLRKQIATALKTAEAAAKSGNSAEDIINTLKKELGLAA